MLARPLVAAAVLLSAGVGSLALAGGTSSATSPTRVTYGPVALPVVVPLVDARGPVLPRVRVVSPALGPVVPAARVGPPAAVGPEATPARVREAQRLLNRAGAGLRVDGAWGPATTRAAEQVQLRSGLPVTGLADPRTLALLRALP